MDAHATICSSYPFTLTNGQVANADQVMADFNCALLTSGGTAASPNFTGTATGTNVIPPSLLTNQNANTVLMNATGVSASPTAVPLANWVQNYKTGLTLSTAGASGTFGVAAGEAANSTNAMLMPLASAYTKTTGAWTLGTGNGCLDTGSIANATWYSEFVIERTDTGVTDILCSTSATSPTMPTNYTLFRRIGSMLTDGSAHWTKFSQLGNEFLWDVPVADISAATISATAQSKTLTVPTGVKVQALFNGRLGYNSATEYGLFSSLDVSDVAPGNADSNGIVSSTFILSSFTLGVRTNTSAQIRVRGSAGDASYYINTYGWDETFGQ